MMHFDVVLSGDNTPISKIHQNSRLNHIFDLILNEIWHPKKLNLWLKKYCMGIWDIVMHLIFSLKSKVFKYFSLKREKLYNLIYITAEISMFLIS